MGSVSDYEVMAEAVAMLEAFGVDFEKRVVSAHRTPDLLCEYAKTARERGIGVIIADARGRSRGHDGHQRGEERRADRRVDPRFAGCRSGGETRRLPRQTDRGCAEG